MTDTAGISGDRIRSFIERVERIDEEIKALNEGKKEVFAEAKGEGFDVKVLREILRLRKQDKDERDEQESPARPVSQGHGERRLVASKGGVAPSDDGDELLVVEGRLFSPRFNQPSTSATIGRARRPEATRRASTSVAGPIHCERRSRWPSSGRREPRAACHA